MVGFFWFLFSGCIHIILTSTIERTQCKYFSKGINALDNSLIKLTLISAAQSHVGGRARSCTHPQFWHTLSSLSACKGVFPLWWIGDKSLPLKAIDVSVLTSGDRGMGNAAEPRDLCLSHPPLPSEHSLPHSSPRPPAACTRILHTPWHDAGRLNSHVAPKSRLEKHGVLHTKAWGCREAGMVAIQPHFRVQEQVFDCCTVLISRWRPKSR